MAEGSAAVATSAPAVSHGGFMLSGDGAAEAVASIKADEAAKEAPEGGDVSKAASELGKRGGKAAAEARAKAAKEAPAEPAAKEPAKDAKPAQEPAEVDDDAEDDALEAKKSRARQRVEEATRKAAEERRERERIAKERDELRAELDRERRARQAPQPASEQRRPAAQAEQPEHDGPPEPKPEDFDDYNQYQQALIDHRVERKLQAVQRQTEERQRAEKRAESVVSKVRGFQSQIQAQGPEFLSEVSEEVLALRPTIALQPGERPTGPNFLADALLHWSDHAPALMRFLTDNPRDFQRIAELDSPYQIVHEVGRLVGRFEAQGGATAGSSPSTERPASKPASSSAPPPVRPVTGAPRTAAGELYREGETFDEWLRRQKR